MNDILDIAAALFNIREEIARLQKQEKILALKLDEMELNKQKRELV